MRIILYIILLCLLISGSVAKENPKAIELECGPGYSFGLYDLNSKYAGDINKNGVFVNFRAVVQSENTLGIGLETGYFNLSHLNVKDYKADQNGVPILIIFTHNFDNIRLVSGVGYYYLFSKISDYSNLSESSEFDFGYTFGLDYSFEISDKLKLRPAVKYYNITEYSKSLLMMNINLEYSINF